MRKPILFLLLCSMSQGYYPPKAHAATAQPFLVKTNQAIEGLVLNAKNRVGLMGATVQIVELGLFTKTNVDGEFSFSQIPAGNYTIQVNYLGMITEEKSFQTGTSSRLRFELKENSITLKDVVVVGKENHRGGATSTKISRTAIEHLQATNLGEVLQLLPGAITSSPDFSNANKVALRQVSADNTGSLGTAVFMNGAPLSNNANLQVSSNGNAGFSSAAGMGVDMRQITADNIESVEVIRGIPSVEYGDLTSGAVIVNTKAVAEAAQAKVRINPNMNQYWVGKGIDLGKNRGVLFVDMDYTKSLNKQTLANSAYNRISTSLQYTNTFGQAKPLYTNSTFSFGYNHSDANLDPDNLSDSVRTYAKDYAYRLSTNGKWNLGYKFARNINYTFSANYGQQKGYQQRYYTSEISAEAAAKENTTLISPYLSSAYLAQMWVNGNPLNLYAKINDNFYLKSGPFNHRLIVGGDWRMDANYGKGKSFDLTKPYRNSNNEGFRDRPYRDIPAMNQIGLYVEDNITARFGDRRLDLQVGLRYDEVQPFSAQSMQSFAPRINASFDLFKQFNLRGGYGLTSKSPTLLYLYPENAYFDYFSLNHFVDQPSERLAYLTTRVFETQNKALKLAKTSKKELGFDWRFAAKKRLSVTAYHEKTSNGYQYAQHIDGVQFSQVPLYTVAQTHPGALPTLSDVVRDTTYASLYNSVTNNAQIINKGVEFDLDLGRFDQIRTSFLLNGAYLSTKSTSSDPYILQQNVAGKSASRIGVFASGRGTKKERLTSTIRAVHNIPELRFIVTLSAQTIWLDRNKYVGYEHLPIGYIPIVQGGEIANIVEFSEAERNQIDPTTDRDIYLSIQDQYFITESWKPLWLFNLKLTKEFAKNLNFSFYANNVINNRPYQTSTRYTTQYTKRNIPIFFGTEISIKF